MPFHPKAGRSVRYRYEDSDGKWRVRRGRITGVEVVEITDDDEEVIGEEVHLDIRIGHGQEPIEDVPPVEPHEQTEGWLR